MKALIRKFPDNAHAEENNEVWFYPWHNGDEQGRPYTLEGYRYALCTNAPDPVFDENGRMISPSPEDFTISENTIEETDPDTGEKRTRRYWTAVYNGA